MALTLWLVCMGLALAQDDDEASEPVDLPEASEPVDLPMPTDDGLPVGATEAPSEPAPVVVQDDDPNEIVVYGPLAVREARSDLVRAVRDRGWEIHKRKGEDIVFRPPKAWMGKAVLKPDGSFDFTRPVLVPKSLDLVDYASYDDYGAVERDADVALVSESDVEGGAYGGSDLGAAAFAVQPRLGLYFMPSRRILDSVRLELTTAVAPQQAHYRKVVEGARRE